LAGPPGEVAAGGDFELVNPGVTAGHSPRRRA
jgi:hypothetical protein